MSLILDDSLEIINLCRTGRDDEVINAMLTDKGLKKSVSYLVKGDKTAIDTLMHDTVLSFVRSCLKDGFVINSNPLAYAKGIAKNIWLMSLRKENAKVLPLDKGEELIDLSNSYEIDYDRKTIVQSLLRSISKDCQDILHYWALKYRMSEIAELMSIDSENYTKKKKHLCLKKLIAIVDKDSKLKEELKLYVR